MSENDQTKFPEGWVEAKLDDLCLVIQGQSPPGETYNTEGIGVPFFQGKAEFGELYAQARKWCISPTKMAQRDDILISIRAPVGPTNLCPSKACIGRGLAAIRPLGGIAVRYMLYGLRATESTLAEKGTGSTFDAISGSDLRKHVLSVAPVTEQYRIVEEIEKQFSRLDAGLAALRKVQAGLKRYRASVLQAACEGRLVPTEAELARQEGRDYEPAEELLKRILTERRAKWETDQLAKMQSQGKPPKDDKWKSKYQEPTPPDTSELPELPEGWCWTSVDTVSSFVTSGSRGWAQYYSSEGPIFLRIGNLDHGTVKLDLADIQHVLLPPNVEGTRTRVHTNDILVSITADLGMIGLVPESIGEAYINQHIALVRPVETIDRSYLAWYLASESGGQTRLYELRRGATKIGLGLDDVKSVPVPLPPLSEQKRIMSEIESRLSVAEVLEIIVGANLDRAEHLRQAILKCAFEGKLVSQDPKDEPASVLLKRIGAERSRQKLDESDMRTKRLGKKLSATMETNKRQTLWNIVSQSSSPLTPEELFKRAGYDADSIDDVDSFFDELRLEVDVHARIIEDRNSTSIVYLKAAKA